MPPVFRVGRLKKKRTPGNPPVGGGGEGLLPALTPADFTYLGAWRVPYPSTPGLSNTAYGLALKRESSDLTEPLHFITGAYYYGASTAGDAGWVYEFRYFTPENPADPTHVNNYTADTGYPVKEYGNIYGTVDDLNTYKRLYLKNGTGDLTQFAHGQLVPQTGLYWDPIAQVLWWSYAATYDGGVGSYHFGFSELSYSTGASTAHGPWKLDAPQFKSSASGFTDVPVAFISATGMSSAQRLAIGFGGVGSVAALGDVSFGPSLTAFDVPDTSTIEQRSRASTPLVGYWPFTQTQTTNDRADRPVGYDFINSIIPFDSWPTDKWTHPDSPKSYGVWIHGQNKGGFVMITALAGGMIAYVNATHAWEYAFPVMSIVSEADMATVAQGASPDSIQPTTTVINFPPIDTTLEPWASLVYANVNTITSVAGESKGATGLFNATVNTTAAHNLQTGWQVSIRGTDHDEEYGGIWEVQVIDATHFKIRNGSANSYQWNGVTATGGAIRGAGQQQIEFARGMTFDVETNTLYFMFRHPEGEEMIAAYSVNC